jgi:hypothetical protein
MMQASQGAPQVFQEHMEPVYRMIKKYEQDNGLSTDKDKEE